MKKPITKFGAYVRNERTRLGLSQRKLAEKTGVSLTTIQRIETENRKTTENNKKAIMKALNKSETDNAIEKHREMIRKMACEAESLIAKLDEFLQQTKAWW